MKYLILLFIFFVPLSCDNNTNDKTDSGNNDTLFLTAIRDNRERPPGEQCFNEWGDCVNTGNETHCFCLADMLDYQNEDEGNGGCVDENGEDCYIPPSELRVGSVEVYHDADTCEQILYNECMPHPVAYSSYVTDKGICKVFGNLIACYCYTGDYIPLSVLSSDDVDIRVLIEQNCPSPQLVDSCSNDVDSCNVFEAGFVCYCGEKQTPSGMNNIEAPWSEAALYAQNRTCNGLMETFCQ